MRRILCMVGTVVMLVSGCSMAEPPTDDSSLISVDITQGRTDRDGRVIVIDVTNQDDAAIELIHAQLNSAQFAEPAAWERGTTLSPGRTVSLRSPLADPVCPVPESTGPTVTVEFRTADGVSHEVTVEPTQPTDILSAVERDDCIAVLAAQHADIQVSDTVDWTPGAHGPARLSLMVTPLDAPGSMRIVSTQDTILLGLIDAAGTKLQVLPLDLAIDAGSAPTQIDLMMVPNRCDPHAVAEDKRGTLLPLTIETSEGVTGVAYFRASDAVKGSLYSFVGDYCGF